MNKSIDSMENFTAESKDEPNKSAVLVSLKHIKGQEPVLQLWNVRTGELIKAVNTRHRDVITGIQKTSDFKIITVSKDSQCNIFF